MLKVRDGNSRAANVALGAVIHALGYDLPEEVLPFASPQLQNWAGQDIGDIRVTGALAIS